jgi:polyisoprenoid-binding protein YceI
VSESVSIPPVGRYTIDPGRSRVTFSGRHLFGLSVRGGFTINSGRIHVVDPVTDSEAEAEIDADSFDTGNRQRDTEIRSKRFLNTGQYPVITFASGHVRQTDDGWVLEGTLTVQDTSKEIRLDIGRASTVKGAFIARARTRINRSDFGIGALTTFGGSTLDLVVDVTATLD